MKKIVIVGATSAIAEAAARLWAKAGAHLYLVARNEYSLKAIGRDLKIRGASSVSCYVMDVNHHDEHPLMFEDALKTLGSIDILLVAHGTFPDQIACEQSAAMTINEINSNGLSVVALLTLAANIFEKQKKGTIAAISSVAGDRGRRSNYVYGCAKALVTAFMSGLRQRLSSSGVSIVTIKPGFVDTPMTATFEKNFLWAKPQAVAFKIVAAIDNGVNVLYVPSFWVFVMFLIKHIPEALFKRIRTL